MIQYVCNQCDKTTHDYAVIVEGVTRLGSILLSGHKPIFHFCSEDCFWNWVARYYIQEAVLNEHKAARS